MNKKYKYIKYFLDQIFSGKHTREEVDDFVEFDEQILLDLPVNLELEEIFRKFDGKVYQGYELKNEWYFMYFGADSLISVMNGNFTFEIAIEIREKDYKESTNGLVVVKNFEIEEVTIDFPEDEVKLV